MAFKKENEFRSEKLAATGGLLIRGRVIPIRTRGK